MPSGLTPLSAPRREKPKEDERWRPARREAPQEKLERARHAIGDQCRATYRS